MQNKYGISMLALTAILLISCIASPPKKIHFWMIGDSTMCLYDSSRAPITGWGMPFAGFFDSSVSVHNHAKGGRSTRTFLGEQRWQPITDSLAEGDYVFIQFGHNDEAKEEKYKDRYTPVEDYKNNLVKFITESRAKKAIPILITPVSRMRFNDKGNALETHKEYSAAVLEVAGLHKVPVIDLDKKSRELIQQMGPQHAKLLFMQLDSLEHPHYPAGSKDNTHFNEYGARRMAELVLADLQQLNTYLAERINKPKKK